MLLWIPFKKLSGKGINWKAWRGSYQERQLPVPPAGQPREGIWGVHLTAIPHPQLGHILPERHVPEMFDIDDQGIQRAVSHGPPKLHLLIIGGSVAAGAYASNLNRTYFSQLAWRLDQSVFPFLIHSLCVEIAN